MTVLFILFAPIIFLLCPACRYFRRGCFLCLQDSSKESLRTFLIPEWSRDEFVRHEWHVLSLRKLFSRFQLHKPDFRCTGWGDSCCVSRASSKESWRTFLIPKWSVHHIGCQEDHIKTLGELCVKFQVSRCTEVPSLHHIKKWRHKDIKTDRHKDIKT